MSVPTAVVEAWLAGNTVSLQSLLTRPYVDVTFTGLGGGTVGGISGGKLLQLKGEGAQNVDVDAEGFAKLSDDHPTPELVSGTTYRYFLRPRRASARPSCSGTATSRSRFPPSTRGEPDVVLRPRRRHAPQTGPQRDDLHDRQQHARQRRGEEAVDGRAAQHHHAVGVVDVKYGKDAKLIVTIGVGADAATLNFGTARSAMVTSSVSPERCDITAL